MNLYSDSITSADLFAVFNYVAADGIPGRGDLTLIEQSGLAVRGIWAQANPSATGRFVQEEQWEAPVYFVQLPAVATEVPYSVALGVELLWQATNYRGVVRNLAPQTDHQDNILYWVALVVLESGS